MLVVHASFPIDPDHREEALEQVRDLAKQSRAEAGMVDYRAGTDVEDENVLRFYEQYEDEDAFAAHTQSDHFGAFEAALGEWLAGEPEVIQFEVESATELDL